MSDLCHFTQLSHAKASGEKNFFSLHPYVRVTVFAWISVLLCTDVRTISYRIGTVYPSDVVRISFIQIG